MFGFLKKNKQSSNETPAEDANTDAEVIDNAKNTNSVKKKTIKKVAVIEEQNHDDFELETLPDMSLGSSMEPTIEKELKKAINAIKEPPNSKHPEVSYDILKKLSDIQDQLSRHDGRILTRIDDHDTFLRTQHHEPVKQATIEILNKIYNQPSPIREQVIKIIQSDEKILDIIGDGKASTREVAKIMNLSREHISRSISVLTKSGMLIRIYDGKKVYYAKTDNASDINKSSNVTHL